MFVHSCSICEQRRLMFPSQIRAMQSTDHGIEVLFTCWCGAAQVMLTGHRANDPEHATVAA